MNTSAICLTLLELDFEFCTDFSIGKADRVWNNGTFSSIGKSHSRWLQFLVNLSSRHRANIRLLFTFEALKKDEVLELGGGQYVMVLLYADPTLSCTLNRDISVCTEHSCLYL